MDESVSRFSLKTPRHDGEVVMAPGLAQMQREAASNAGQLRSLDVKVLDRPLRDWRDICRDQLSELAQYYSGSIGLGGVDLNLDLPLIVTGHQAQFFHCGILIKYVLADSLARSVGSCPINLVVDSDLPKNLSLNLPVQGEQGLTRQAIHWSGLNSSLAMENQPLPSWQQMDQWMSQMTRLKLSPMLGKRVAMIRQAISQASRESSNLVDLYVLINQLMARSLSLRWLDLPVSWFCESESYLAFVADLLLKSQQCHHDYNKALAQFRDENNLRNPSQPLPDLAVNGMALEMPFWVFRPGHPRQPLWLHHQPDGMVFFDGQEELAVIEGEKDLSNENMIATLRKHFIPNEIFIRPRALTLTIFARLFLADYFIHGLGGARYDQVTDRFIRTFYGCEPPDFACASATARLPYPGGDSLEAIEQALQENRTRQRDFRYNPQNYRSQASPETLKQRQALIEESDRLQKENVRSSRRDEVFRLIHQANANLVKENRPVAEQLEREGQHLTRQLQETKIMADREYFFGLFDPEKLKDLHFD